MIDQPAEAPLVLTDRSGSKIILTDLRWPFEQLGAQGVPRELPLADPDVILTLSVLAGQTPTGIPTLIKVNPDGSITTSIVQLAGTSFDVHQGSDPDVICNPFGIALGAGASAAIISGTVNVTICYLHLHVELEGAAGASPQWALQDSGIPTDIIDGSTGQLGPRDIPLYGLSLFGSSGHAALLKNYDTVAHNFRGAILFKQLLG